MKLIKSFLCLLFCLMLLPVSTLCEEYEDSGDPPLAPWLYLMSNGSCVWNCTSSDTSVLEIRDETTNLDWLHEETDRRLLLQAKECLAAELYGNQSGSCDVTLSYTSGSSEIWNCTLRCSVDEAGNVIIQTPLYLPCNPTTGYTWCQEDNGAPQAVFGDFAAQSNELVGAPGTLPVSFEQAGEDSSNPIVLVNKRSWEDSDPIAYLEIYYTSNLRDISALCMYDFFLNVPVSD